MDPSPPVDRAPADTAPTGLDQRSIETAFTRYSPDCYRFALRIVRDRELAKDVVQDVFETLVAQPERFSSDRGSLLSWLMTLTHNKAVDLIRWHHRHARLDVPLSSHDVSAAASDDHADFTVTVVERERLVKGLRGLSADECEVLVLAHICSLTQVEIAQRTGVPLGTVKGRARAGTQRLRYRLEVDPQTS